VLVYANSSKIEKAAEKFMEQYPNIKVEGFDLGGDDVYLKTVEEQKAEAFTGDIWFSSGGPNIKGELIPQEYIWRYVPDVYKDVVPANLSDPLLTARFGVRILAYNKELNPDGCPVSNLWELTNPEWKGKVHIEDPLNDASTLGILMTIASHSDEMLAAYKDLYGADPVLDADTPDAGQLWLKRFAQNSPVPEPGGDEVDSAFATPGMKDNLLGFTSYSNYPDVLDGALAFEPCWDAKPSMGVITQSYLGILNQAPHPNAAKLFIRFILTEEGADPWMKIGNYLPRTDIPAPEGAKPFEELQKITYVFDDGYVYDNIIQARDFYLLNLAK
jgi:iron(III) transport system substrate-binding protein